MLKYLFPFMDADGATGGAVTAQDGAEENTQEQEASGQEGADERKTGDVKSEAQNRGWDCQEKT